jgi:hypothetical protein
LFIAELRGLLDSTGEEQYHEYYQYDSDHAARRISPGPAVRPAWKHAEES